jgi:hypothetical protein
MQEQDGNEDSDAILVEPGYDSDATKGEFL